MVVDQLNHVRRSSIWKLYHIGLQRKAILNIDLKDGTCTQATLPVSAGGIDVRKSQDLSVPAFISSSHSTEMLVDAVLHNIGIPASARISLREVAQEDWAERSGSAEAPEDSEKYKQKAWDFFTMQGISIVYRKFSINLTIAFYHVVGHVKTLSNHGQYAGLINSLMNYPVQILRRK